jgi:hypothetical protein
LALPPNCIGNSNPIQAKQNYAKEESINWLWKKLRMP